MGEYLVVSHALCGILPSDGSWQRAGVVSGQLPVGGVDCWLPLQGGSTCRGQGAQGSQVQVTRVTPPLMETKMEKIWTPSTMADLNLTLDARCV